jgi:hypothetical protein
MTPRTSRLGRNPVVFWSFALLVGLSGTAAKADPLYTVTNLGSGNINLATASGGTIAVSPGGLPYGSSLATSQLVSVSNGQVSYPFATTPDTQLVQGQGPLSSIPQMSSYAAPQYGPDQLSGLENANGFAAVLASQLYLTNGQTTLDTLIAASQNPGGTLGLGATITSTPNDGIGGISIAGINTANQVLLGTSYSISPYNDAMVYNMNTQTLTDLQSLPAISAGGYNNLVPIAIDNQGQVLIIAPFDATANGSGVDTLLLTPGATAPEPLATPEPSTWLIWTLIGGAALRFVNRRTGPSDSSRAGRTDSPAPAV